MLSGKRFVLAGLSRLTVHVAQRLREAGGTVAVIQLGDEESGLIARLPEGVQVERASPEDPADALRAVGLPAASCLLALASEDLDNLKVAVAAREVAPETPVVLRVFDPALGDQLEDGLNIRRAYSVSALGAPAFVAAACGDEVLQTMRLGDGEVPLCRLQVRRGSRLLGLSPAEVEERLGSVVLLRAGDGGDLQAPGGAPLQLGEQVLLGGPLEKVLHLVVQGAGWVRRGRRRLRLFHRRPRGRRALPRLTRLPIVAAGLLLMLLLSVLVFRVALKLRLVDAVYFVITTATTTGYGDISLKDAPDWVKLFGNLVMLIGGALLGILFSYLASVALAERLDEAMGRRAERMSGHVVVAGLGNLGYRVTRLLIELGVDVVVIELTPDARFVEAVRARAPVLVGDARLPESLQHASIDHAVAFIACTDDDLVNVQACLHARRLRPTLHTVARVSDDKLAQGLQRSTGIGQVLSATGVAAQAFVGAATDALALRPLAVGPLDYVACRYQAPAPVPAADLDAWRADGVRVLALRASGGLLPPGEPIASLSSGDEAILCGPAAAVRRILGEALETPPA